MDSFLWRLRGCLFPFCSHKRKPITHPSAELVAKIDGVTLCRVCVCGVYVRGVGV